MEEERKKEIELMAKDIDPITPDQIMKPLIAEDISADIIRSKVTGQPPVPEPEEPTLIIPMCSIIPTNGRIFCVEIASRAVKSPSGLWLPYKMAMQKDDSVKSPGRYFAVTWDKDEIPESIQKKLAKGIELNPFMPEDAIGYKLPRVIDWITGHTFSVMHYTELAGISQVQPIDMEKGA